MSGADAGADARTREPRLEAVRLPRTMIRLEALRKSFGALDVLHGIDLEIERGKVTAIVGPNGAGKSTLIKMVLGLVKPDSGCLWVDGEPIDGRPDYREAIGYMPQMGRFPENLTPRELIHMLQDLRGGAGRLDEDLIDTFRLAPELDKRVRTLSGGTRQKMNAALAFLFTPELLVLDEPTAGLDPVSSSLLKDRIREVARRGRTVILTSHIMAEIEEMADDVAFLLDGRIRFFGPLGRLKAETGGANLERAIARMMTEQADRAGDDRAPLRGEGA